MSQVHPHETLAREDFTTGRYVLTFDEADRSRVSLVGGKGAHVAELSHVEGVPVPDGFCVTTAAFRRVVVDGTLNELLEALSHLKLDDQEAIRALSAELRQTIEALPFPEEVAAEVARAHARLGAEAAYAVRSSATAEDSPTTSFAGQHDTYLNVVGLPAVLDHVRRCWASLFTERAVTYGLRSGLDHRDVQMAVVVQRMVLPRVSGVLFTADPTSGNRKVSVVEACFGLGEALVGGLVNADTYKVRDGVVLAETVGRKRLAVEPLAGGGTRSREVDPDLQGQPALTHAEILRLERLGRSIEACFGAPQDIEWCLADDGLHVVQSRPITTLFPIPEGEGPRVYVSVGHQQMMTDAMRPLGLSLWQLKAARPMAEAGGRLFVDVTAALASPQGRAALLSGLGKSDPLIGDALQTLVDRGDLLPPPPEGPLPGAAMAAAMAAPLIEADPALVARLIARGRAELAALEREIVDKSGAELLDLIRSDTQRLRALLFDPEGTQALMSGIRAAWWLHEHMEAWLGVKNAADTLTQSVADNVTSQMGLALLDVADVIRRHPEVVAFLEHVEDDAFIDQLPSLEGGREAREALEAWLDTYGMRGPGEIDITRPRFAERPTMVVPMILGNVRSFPPGEAERRFEEGRRNALRLERELLERLRALPDGDAKAEETQRMIRRVRTFAGYREYPKYAWVACDFVYKQALLREAERLARAGVLGGKEDIFFLRFEELEEVVRTGHVDGQLVRERKEAFATYEGLRPPRVMTSEGEAVAGTYRRENLPPGALVGLPVSAGVVEGRARVVLDLAHAALEPGDVLVTAHTDPSWTPLFVAIRALVTEVGGLVTHGAVIAREYGLPAVVGVEDATRLIRDGQRIRVDGTNGTVEILR